uniref:Uncharacterized protein n=1 Tax=Mustela putorius furo TaxID=9669 RepID=M3Y1A2_MUSPF
ERPQPNQPSNRPHHPPAAPGPETSGDHRHRLRGAEPREGAGPQSSSTHVNWSEAVRTEEQALSLVRGICREQDRILSSQSSYSSGEHIKHQTRWRFR